MKVWAMMYYGSGYRPPDQFDRRDVERYPSIKSAVDAFESRCDNHPYYPCVDKQTAELQIFLYDPYQDGDCQPDRIYKFGSREGIRRDL